MKGILSELYGGGICTKEHIEAMLKECKETERITRMYEESFEEKLDKNLFKEFSILMFKYYELNDDEVAEAFAKGFSFGARFMIEALSR